MSIAISTETLESAALMFPGQGSQYPGMGADLAAESSKAREIFQRADDILGYSLSRIMFEDPGEELLRTVHTQPAVFVHSMAVLGVLNEHLHALAGSRRGAFSGRVLSPVRGRNSGFR